MIKGKWRIDLGGKIKGAKSVALGSAVTKRGQDNSLQMCERCKYQTGEGRRLGGPGKRGGGWAASGVGRAGDPWRQPHTPGPSPVGVRREENGLSGNPKFQAGVPFLRRSFAGQVLPPQSHSHPAGDLRSRVQIPPESLCAPLPRHQAFPTSPRPARWTQLCRPLSRPPPRRPASHPLSPPRPGGRQWLPPRWKPLAPLCAEVTLPRSREPRECK